MEGNRHQEIGLPSGFDVDEVTIASPRSSEVIHAGIVRGWEQLEIERAKLRPFITGIVLSTWVGVIVVSALKYVATGDFLLFTPSALITVPLYLVLKFYYRSG